MSAAEIVFDRVSKRYPGREQHALHELSLEIPAGAFCVLVGPSGGGKTTALKMVNRLISFDDGDIRFRTWPVFTAVCQDAAQLGFEAALSLTRKLTGVIDGQTVQREMNTFFEVHETTGLPPARPVRVLPNGRRVSETIGQPASLEAAPAGK